MKAFDRKFGKELLQRLPSSPGVYRVYGDADALLYVGKAKNLRRRLAQYRNARRIKKHRRMKAVVSSGTRLEWTLCESETDARLLENELIRTHRPPLNVSGAYSFLYPYLGVLKDPGGTFLCVTTRPELFPEFRFHGCFRSRALTREAHHALARLLAFVGHRIRKGQLARFERDRYSSVAGFRQLPSEWVRLLERFWEGSSIEAIEALVLALVESADARLERREVQRHLDALKAFWRHEAERLAKARRLTGYEVYPVPQTERDALLIRAKSRI